MGRDSRSRKEEWRRSYIQSQPWHQSTFTHKHEQLRFLGDPSGAFAKALDLDFDATAIFGGPRSKRYALVVEDGKVKEAHVEPDNTGVNGKYSSTHLLVKHPH